MLIFFPLAYVLYFSSQRAMLVRNLQLMQPFGALFAASGAVACVRAARGVWPRRVVAGAVALGLVWNAAWLVRADASILGRERIDWQAQVTRFCARQEEPVFLGKNLRARLGVDCVGPLIAAGRVTMDPAQAGRVVLYPADIELPNREAYERFIANVRGTYQLLPAGPWEVHWDYYPTWAGDPRPIVISAEYYRSLVARP
jgi:hypothetical protein